MPRVDTIPASFKMNYDNILNKPFLIASIPWNTNSGVGELFRIPFPSAIMTNPLASIPFEASVFFQADMCTMLQVSGTPMHMGTVCVACVPNGSPKIEDVNSILSAPHVFLSANESTSVCLESPMYIPTVLARTQAANVDIGNKTINYCTQGTDVFDLVFFVLNNLEVSSGASNSITISVSHIYKQADFYVPKVSKLVWKPESEMVDVVWSMAKWVPVFCTGVSLISKVRKFFRRKKKAQNFHVEGFVDEVFKMPTQIADDVSTGLKKVSGDIIDYMRRSFRTLTGFHNPNIPTLDKRVVSAHRNFVNNVDIPTHMEVLDPHANFSRIYDDHYFRTTQDEMDINYLCAKPVYLSSFQVKESNSVGQLLFAVPITPMVEASVLPTGNASTIFYSNMRTIYECSKYWRGSLKLHIQANCTNFHFCKIVVVLNYAGVANTLTTIRAFPEYRSTHNLPNTTLEFSAGGQIQTIDLPFVSNFRQLECTKDYLLNALQHGVVYGYLVQPLTSNGSVPKDILFNVYMSGGDDLQFSGYATDSYSMITGVAPTYPAVPNLFGKDSGVYETYKEGDLVGATGRYISSSEQKISVVLRGRVLKPGGFIAIAGDTWESLSKSLSISVAALQAYTKSRVWIKTAIAVGDEIYYEPLSFKAESGVMTSDTPQATVTPSGQDEILNQFLDQKEDIRMALRPNTSLRDYLRRMTPVRNIVIAPAALLGTHEIRLADFFTVGVSGASEVSGNQMLASMFLGISGGFKIKLRIAGATTASVHFVPPAGYCINGSYNKIYPCMTNVADVNIAAAVLARQGFTNSGNTTPFTSPCVEHIDVTMSYGMTDPTLTSTSSNIFEVEMIIPNLNQNNYVGGTTKWFGAMDTQNDFGSLIVSYVAATDKAGAKAPISVFPFWGFADETRVGFNTYNPRKRLVTVYSTSTPSNNCRVSTNNTLGVASVIPSALRLSSLPPTGAYYFN